MRQIVVAIPVRDEAALIPDCLRALALQQGDHRAEILLLVNNSTDGTAEIAHALRPTLPCLESERSLCLLPYCRSAGADTRLGSPLGCPASKIPCTRWRTL